MNSKVVFLLLGVVAVGTVFVMGVPDWLRSMTSSFDQAALERFEKLIDADAEPELESDQTPYRTGKILLIVPGSWRDVSLGGGTVSATQVTASFRGRLGARLSEPEVDKAQSALPSEVRADSEAEVATVIFCERRRNLARGLIVFDADTGRVMSTQPPADSRSIALTVLDVKSKTLIARLTLLEESDETLPKFVATMPFAPEFEKMRDILRKK